MLLNISSRGYGVNAQPCPAAAGEAAEDRSRELGLPLYKLERCVRRRKRRWIAR